MGNLNLNQAFNFKCLCTILFFLFLLSHTATAASSPSSNQQIQPQNPSSTTPVHHYQVFYHKNTDPMFLNRQERFKKRRTPRNKNMKHGKKKKKMVKNLQLRSFSVMLPKGFVPPSGSSPCHNDQPNSVSYFRCHLTTAEP